MWKYGKTSLARLKTCHGDLGMLFTYAIAHKDCPCDVAIVCGSRGEAEQMAAYNSVPKRSNARYGESPHNFTQSRAVDVAPYENGGIPWNDEALFKKLSGHIKKCAAELGVLIKWGGDFKSIKDMPHYELLNWKNLES